MTHSDLSSIVSKGQNHIIDEISHLPRNLLWIMAYSTPVLGEVQSYIEIKKGIAGWNSTIFWTSVHLVKELSYIALAYSNSQAMQDYFSHLIKIAQ